MGTSDVAILPPGTVVGDTYEIVREVATGGMGTVYEARNVRLSKRRVAVKVLSKLTTKSAELLPRFRREAEIGASLNHPNIITVTDWNTLPDGLPFFVMEFLEGESLAERMRRSRLDFDLGMSVLDSVAGALHAAHQQGVIHRDLKPSNVFLARVEGSDRPFVKVLDFGISKLIFDETLETTSKLLGTPRYMSPEQVRNRPLDVRSDEFALATMAYEIFSGRLAFPGDSLESILYHVVHDDPVALREHAPELPEHIVSAIERGMAKDPDARFDSVGEFSAALRGEWVRPSATTSEMATAILDSADVGSPSSGPVRNTPEVLAAQRGDTLLIPAADRYRDTSSLAIARRRLVAWLAGGSLLLGVGAVFAYQVSGPDKRDASSAVAELGSEAGSDPDPTSESDPSSDDGPSPDRNSDPDPPPDGGAEDPTTPGSENTTPVDVSPSSNPETPARNTARPSEPRDVANRLNRAEKQLEAGRYRDALRLAQQSMIQQKTPRAHRIMTLCYCGMRDLGSAKASLHRVPAGDRKRVMSQCRALGLDL